MKWWAQQDLNLRPTPKAFRAALTAEPPVKQWAQRDLNPRPSDYESPALTAELWAHKPIKSGKNSREPKPTGWKQLMQILSDERVRLFLSVSFLQLPSSIDPNRRWLAWF